MGSSSSSSSPAAAAAAAAATAVAAAAPLAIFWSRFFGGRPRFPCFGAIVLHNKPPNRLAISNWKMNVERIDEQKEKKKGERGRDRPIECCFTRCEAGCSQCYCS